MREEIICSACGSILSPLDPEPVDMERPLCRMCRSHEMEYGATRPVDDDRRKDSAGRAETTTYMAPGTDNYGDAATRPLERMDRIRSQRRPDTVNTKNDT